MRANISIKTASTDPAGILHGAVDELKSRADSGDAAARHELAEFLIPGDPAAPGYDSAVSWLRSMASENRDLQEEEKSREQPADRR